ncbi:putative phenylacetone monooxygenase [Diaporthe ampelina]|uniref:Putative phenylacetone monooxygenase n=1 Tax=Diaporthe ampelina TaxID=1214573 RepID=A0A0G2HDK7_9PEZI|nr:putative phenylacetone monooxygenase [Diaporthe ampelina]
MGSLNVEHTYDVLIIGAGLSGICSLHHIRERFPTWSVKVIEAASDVGGVWHWNRYPGCRLDTESISYGYSFDKEFLQQWEWKDTFSSQAEMQEYIQSIAKKHDLYKDIQFDTRITSAHWHDQDHTWTFVDERGDHHKTRFFVSCLGFLSAPTWPAIPGLEDFKGQAYHTSRWPKGFDISRDLEGKRVGVIGTGATGIQTITAISKEPGIQSLTVFQRTANWSAPLRNAEITPEQMDKYRSQYDDTFDRCAQTSSGFLHQADPRKSLDVSQDERLAHYEKLYAEPGFGKWLGVFSDTYTDREANRLYSEFIAGKIRELVKDPETAENLIPTHGYGTRRVPLNSGYFEAFNKPHVKVVNLRKTPAERVTSGGIITSDGKEHKLDVLICATGFDAVTGAFNAIDWHARDGRPLIATSETKDGERAIWPDHRPQTFLGVTVPALPNTFLVLGPHQPFGNATRSIEHVVGFVTDALQYCKDNGYSYVEATKEAADEWTDHVVECSKAGTLINEVDSWMTGVNTNVKGKQVRSVARYSGSVIEYRRRTEACKKSGYKGLVFA